MMTTQVRIVNEWGAVGIFITWKPPTLMCHCIPKIGFRWR